MHNTLKEYPVLAISGGLGALLVLPFLAVLYWLANVRYWVCPLGDQPKVIRREYAARLQDGTMRTICLGSRDTPMVGN